ncbi:MAG: DUF1553 domain-containing protein [Verrucomicrobiae bacterium]|nr:DUF1553 domain-containing protein [Verrucomicrobiae bacterium]
MTGVLWGGLGILSADAEESSRAAKIDFNRSIRPLLAEHCLHCHGQDEKAREAELRLDDREVAISKEAIVPGNPTESELALRIRSEDADEVMPPPDWKTKLTESERDLLETWIAQGANYAKHWSLIPPVRPEIPKGNDPGVRAGLGIRTPIDAFVTEALEQRGWTAALEAGRAEWLRRVTFDLTGLPASPAEMKSFEENQSPAAYEEAVDRLLKSQAFGEQLGRLWLDAARYADSMGRHEDSDMAVWPYRDWVIHSINENKPFDQFVIEQNAGDLLPHPTREQRVATVFNRLAQQSNESGSDEEEFRLDQVNDRVMTNGLAFLGLTLDCARCHDHKFDPVTQREYWQMAAFFDNVHEVGIYSRYAPEAAPAPAMPYYLGDQEKRHREVLRHIEGSEARMAELKESARTEFDQWLSDHREPGPLPDAGGWKFAEWFGFGKKDPRTPWEPEAIGHFTFDHFKDRAIFNEANPEKNGLKRSSLVQIDGPKGKAMVFEGEDRAEFEGMGLFHRWDPFSFAIWMNPREARERSVVLHHTGGGTDDGRGYEVVWQDGKIQFALCHLYVDNAIRIQTVDRVEVGEWTHLAVTYDGSSRAAGMRIYLNGEEARIDVLDDSLRQDIVHRPEWGDILDEKEVTLELGFRLRDLGMVNAAVDDFWMFDRAITGAEVKTLAGREEAAPEEWFDWWLAHHHEEYRALANELRKLHQRETEVTNGVEELMVMAELTEPRPSFVRVRGDYRQRGERVSPDTPASILPFPADLPRNRLGFARWLVHPDQPLTSRVTVNRLWQMFFGRGLVGTPEDFGVRGELPDHPELFDWLAVEFRESGWDVKALCRMIALSSVYRQSARPSDPAFLDQDPDNRLLARGPARRLAAEEIRDAALAAGDLLVRDIGGPSVRPYVPNRFYQDAAIQQSYVQDHGDGLHRRSLYTFWRRTLPPPNLQAFDAPSRDVCTARREITSTPSQALVLLNDPQFVEAQRVTAEEVLGEVSADNELAVTVLFQRILGREPSPAERAILAKAYEEEREWYRAHPEEASQFVKNAGEHPAKVGLAAGDVAALSLMARTLMSHEEFLHSR